MQDMGAFGSVEARPGLVVTLDALGTIYKFRQPVSTQYLNVARRCGVKSNIAEKDLTQAFKKSFKASSDRFPIYGKGNPEIKGPREWWNTVVNDAFRQVVHDEDLPKDLGDELYDHFHSSAGYELYPDVMPFLTNMQDLKLKYNKAEDPPIFVGVITNSDPRVKGVLQQLGIKVGVDFLPTMQRAFEHVRNLAQRGAPASEALKTTWLDAYNTDNHADFLTTSYESGHEKPSSRIFESAVEMAKLNYASKLDRGRGNTRFDMNSIAKTLHNEQQAKMVQKWRCIHIGDEYNKDYVGATKAGWEAMHLVRDGESNPVPEATTISSLEEAAIAIRIIAEQHFSEKGK